MNMSRFAPYLGILAALALGVVIALFSGSTTVVRAPAPVAPTASSTLAVVPNATMTSPTLTGTTTTTSVPSVPVVPKKKMATPVSAPMSVVASPPAPRAPTQAEFDASAAALRAALVNIICYVPPGSGVHSISGSGVIVDEKGIILTNAHIAQYFLLTHRGASCSIRSGSPARDAYTAALIYISPAWLKMNANIIIQTAPSGTGEHDFALLAITKSATTNPLPSSFPAVPLAILPILTNTPVVIASYGAQFLESNQIQSNLFPTIVFGSVKDIYTYGTNTIDVLSLGGSAAAQEGSSGGGVADAYGTLVGTITTSTVKGDTSSRTLAAITTSYIRAEYASETGQPLDLLLAQPLATSIANFAPQIPALESILTAQLP